ncbi:hypothetical protein [Galbibacter orientalis]|uniref:hypothetical protein n=1 Tax=Galbibacter orientalis TaxID=453852 RepID=UPI003080C054
MKKFPDIKEDDEYWFSMSDLKEYDLKTLPENLDIIIDSGIEEKDNFPVTQLNRIDNQLKLGVSKILRPEEFWKQKHTALQFATAIVNGLKTLKANNLNIDDADFQDDGAEDGICIWWSLYLPLETSISQIEKSILKSVEMAYNQALNYMEGLSSVLILGKDSDEYLEKLKYIAKIVEEQGYNPIIIKEKGDLLGEKVIQKVLRYGLQSKFVIVENTESSGHLYEVPHIVKMAEKITIVLQENGKGATWMFEDMYFSLRTAKRFYYDNNDEDLKNKIIEAIKWANLTFEQLCEYQTKELPWLKEK